MGHIRPAAWLCAAHLFAFGPASASGPEPHGDEVEVDEAAVETAGGPAEPRFERLTRIALYDLSVTDLSERATRVFVESLAVELRKLRAVDVVTMDEIRTMIDVEAQKQLLGCDEESSCLAEIGDALGADFIVTGSVATVGGDRLLGLQRIDQRSASVSERVQMRLEDAGGEELLAAVGPAVEQLFSDRELRPGAERGVDPSVAMRLHPPPLPAWSFWTALSVAGGTVAVGAGLLALAAVPYAEAQRLAALSAAEPVPASAVKGAYENANFAFLGGQALITAGVLGLGLAGVMAFFTDFAGVGSDP